MKAQKVAKEKKGSPQVKVGQRMSTEAKEMLEDEMMGKHQERSEGRGEADLPRTDRVIMWTKATYEEESRAPLRRKGGETEQVAKDGKEVAEASKVANSITISDIDALISMACSEATAVQGRGSGISWGASQNQQVHSVGGKLVTRGPPRAHRAKAKVEKFFSQLGLTRTLAGLGS